MVLVQILVTPVQGAPVAAPVMQGAELYEKLHAEDAEVRHEAKMAVTLVLSS